MIIGISGKAGSGKDTLADTLVDDHGFVKVALADPMKRFCMEVFDFTEEQLWGPSEKRNAIDQRYRRWPNEETQLFQRAREDLLAATDQEVLDLDGPWLTPRYALQQLGTEWGRDCYPDVWVDYALRVAKKLLFGGHRYSATKGLVEDDYERFRYDRDFVPTAPPKGVIIPDIRFINELAAVKKLGKVVRVKRGPGWGPSGARAKHKSETEQDGIHDNEFHFVFENNGALDDLLDYAGWLMGQLRGEEG